MVNLVISQAKVPYMTLIEGVLHVTHRNRTKALCMVRNFGSNWDGLLHWLIGTHTMAIYSATTTNRHTPADTTYDQKSQPTQPFVNNGRGDYRPGPTRPLPTAVRQDPPGNEPQDIGSICLQ